MQPRKNNRSLQFIVIGCVLTALVALAIARPVGQLILNSNRAQWEKQARLIGTMLFAYAVDNNGKYPSGNSSTEVFQKLIDGHYANDPNLFYLPLVGKFKPMPGGKLKPQNVGFDITSNVSIDDSEGLPVVFVSGYQITYIPDGTAMPRLKSQANSGFQSPWPGWLMDFVNSHSDHEIAVYYKGNTTDYKIRSEGLIPHFISGGFDARGKTYRQLTPDGSLP